MTSQLNTLVRLRQYEVDRGRAQLAALAATEHEFSDRLATLTYQIELHRHQLASLSQHGRLNIDAIRLRQQYLQLLGRQQQDLSAELAAAREAVEQHRERLIAADQRLRVAEKLRERALDKAAATQLRQESQF